MRVPHDVPAAILLKDFFSFLKVKRPRKEVRARISESRFGDEICTFGAANKTHTPAASSLLFRPSLLASRDRTPSSLGLENRLGALSFAWLVPRALKPLRR